MPDDKTMNITTPQQAEDVGVGIHGDPNAWVCVSKAWHESEGWMKSTKVMEVRNQGCLVQVTTQQRNAGGAYVVAEALTFVPNAKVKDFLPPETKKLRKAAMPTPKSRSLSL